MAARRNVYVVADVFFCSSHAIHHLSWTVFALSGGDEASLFFDFSPRACCFCFFFSLPPMTFGLGTHSTTAGGGWWVSLFVIRLCELFVRPSTKEDSPPPLPANQKETIKQTTIDAILSEQLGLGGPGRGCFVSCG